ncbi:MAG: hypothetical protein EOP24_24465 [Hyphomicrobiales bacterium]|nr:MAG: hypothetical protein EOP24_24465 [Hyphomicrobiales bacterium]
MAIRPSPSAYACSAVWPIVELENPQPSPLSSPRKRGSTSPQARGAKWIPAFAGMTPVKGRLRGAGGQRRPHPEVTSDQAGTA